jgi:hypothetical protein
MAVPVESSPLPHLLSPSTDPPCSPASRQSSSPASSPLCPPAGTSPCRCPNRGQVAMRATDLPCSAAKSGGSARCHGFARGQAPPPGESTRGAPALQPQQAASSTHPQPRRGSSPPSPCYVAQRGGLKANQCGASDGLPRPAQPSPCPGVETAMADPLFSLLSHGRFPLLPSPHVVLCFSQGERRQKEPFPCVCERGERLEKGSSHTRSHSLSTYVVVSHVALRVASVRPTRSCHVTYNPRNVIYSVYDAL